MRWFNTRTMGKTVREQVRQWAKMNKDARVHHVVAVSKNTALVLYERDRMNYQLVLTVPRGEKDAVAYYSITELPERRRHLRSQVERALLLWELSTRDAEIESLYKDVSTPE